MTRLIRYLTLALLTVMPATAHAEWRAIETAHFIIYTESGDKAVARLASRLESIDGLMRMATAISDDVAPVKVRIYEVASNEEVESALGLSNSGIAGFYDSNVLGPFAVTPRKTTFQQGSFTPELVLHHEYAHHFMLQYFPANYPNWYVEGFAELIGSSKILPDGKVGYGLPAVHRGDQLAVDWVPLGQLLTQPPEKIYGLDLYGQGWALTHFLTFSKGRATQLRAYLAALNAGKPLAEAAQAFGDLRVLDHEAHAYVQAGSFAYTPVAVPIAQPVVRAVRPVSAAEAALIPEIIAFRDDELSGFRKEAARDREKRLREANLQSIRRKAALFPNDPFALYLLAQAEYSADHYAASEEAADRLLALDPNHVRGLVIKSINLARAAGALLGTARNAKASEARALAIKANQLDSSDPLPWLAYYQSYHLAGLTPIPQAVNNLADVVGKLPADTKARQLLVDELAARQRWAEAIEVLRPIASSTHDSPQRTAAREQLAKLVAALAKARGAQAAS